MDPSDRPQPALGKAVRQLREKRGLAQEALAARAEVSTGILGMIERGQGNPTWDTVKGIAAALDVSIGELAKLSEKFES